MLKRFHIQNFKSLVDFSLDDMGQFVCLTGLNGAGKTSVLQAIDFISHLVISPSVSGGLTNWLKEREWSAKDLQSQISTKHTITFELELELKRGNIIWSGSFNTRNMRCTTEEVKFNGKTRFEISEGDATWTVGEKKNTIDVSQFDFSGSALSMFRFADEADPLNQLKIFLSNFKTLEMLSPNKMRQKSRSAEDIGLGGEKLSGYIHNLDSHQKLQLAKELSNFYPKLKEINTKTERAGWAELIIHEDYIGNEAMLLPELRTSARHLNDGLLRILTLVSQVQTENQFLLFDEIENGINPELVGQLVNYLLNAKQQIMVTTHNPVILNFLPDERAKESVFFLYRTARGETRAKRFFDIPEVAQKLEVLGPGEVFLDTSLIQLSEELGQQ